LKKLPRKKPHRAVVMVVPPLVDVEVHLPVVVYARPSVEEVKGLEVKVPVCHRHHCRPMNLKLMPKRRKLGPNRSSRHRHHPTWWT
jgi:hypothetical protein